MSAGVEQLAKALGEVTSKLDALSSALASALEKHLIYLQHQDLDEWERHVSAA